MSPTECTRRGQRKTTYMLQILEKGLEMYCSRALRQDRLIFSRQMLW